MHYRILQRNFPKDTSISYGIAFSKEKEEILFLSPDSRFPIKLNENSPIKFEELSLENVPKNLEGKNLEWSRVYQHNGEFDPRQIMSEHSSY